MVVIAAQRGLARSKRSIKWLMRHVTETEGPDVAQKLWRKLGRLCAKLLLAVPPKLATREKKASHRLLFAGVQVRTTIWQQERLRRGDYYRYRSLLLPNGNTHVVSCMGRPIPSKSDSPSLQVVRCSTAHHSKAPLASAFPGAGSDRGPLGEVAPTIEAEGLAQLPKDLSGGAFFAGGRQRCFEVRGEFRRQPSRMSSGCKACRGCVVSLSTALRTCLRISAHYPRRSEHSAKRAPQISMSGIDCTLLG